MTRLDKAVSNLWSLLDPIGCFRSASRADLGIRARSRHFWGSIMKAWIVACAAVLMLYAAPAWAGQCDVEIAEVEEAIRTTTDIEPEVLDAASELLVYAILECVDDDPLAETATPGFAYLAAARSLLGIN